MGAIGKTFLIIFAMVILLLLGIAIGTGDWFPFVIVLFSFLAWLCGYGIAVDDIREKRG